MLLLNIPMQILAYLNLVFSLLHLSIQQRSFLPVQQQLSVSFNNPMPWKWILTRISTCTIHEQASSYVWQD